MKSKSATLEDVARHAGVSYQTVSRVLNKSANVSEATRRKVEKSIEALRYVPNRLAQQLVGKESQTVGLVTISLAWHAPSQVAAAVKRYANLEGYQVLISMIDESVNQSIQDSINELKSQRVDKVIINVPLETEQAQKIAADNDDIVCLFLDVDPYSSVFNVSFNPADGTRASVKYLYEMGHREIALLAVPGEKSVIGYDDTYESSFFYPALSTVSLDLDLQGKEAVRRILASTSGAPHASSILPARLVIRHSSGARIEQGKDLQAIAEQLRAIAHRLAP